MYEFIFLLMKKSIKILISVIISIFVVIGFDCLYGFTIGGRVGWLFYILSAIVGAILIVSLMLFIKGKEYFYTKDYIEPLVLLLIVAVVLCWGTYNGLNKLSSSPNYTEYDSVAVEVYTPLKSMHDEITFLDADGNEVTINEHQPVGESVYPEENDTITIREYKGGFGYNYYEIIKVNGTPRYKETNSKE